MRKPTIEISETSSSREQVVEATTEATGGQVQQVDPPIPSPDTMNECSIRDKVTESENVLGSSRPQDTPNEEEKYELSEYHLEKSVNFLVLSKLFCIK